MSKIVAAVGVSANALDSARRPLAKLIEAAMSEAITQATAEGITDPVEVKARMMAARVKVLERIDDAETYQQIFENLSKAIFIQVNEK